MNEEFRERMYDLLILYAKPYSSQEPVINIDEKSKQLIADTRSPILGKSKKQDYEYERKGTRNIFLAVEPKKGSRYTKATKHRKRKDFAFFMKDIVMRKYKKATKIHIVLDNLNTHFPKSFFKTFPKEEAERILSKIQFHYTPKHASWLNMAEIEIGIMDRQCLNRRIPSEKDLKASLSLWQKARNQKKSKILWNFTKQDADAKLSKHYI